MRDVVDGVQQQLTEADPCAPGLVAGVELEECGVEVGPGGPGVAEHPGRTGRLQVDVRQVHAARPVLDRGLGPSAGGRSQEPEPLRERREATGPVGRGQTGEQGPVVVGAEPVVGQCCGSRLRGTELPVPCLTPRAVQPGPLSWQQRVERGLAEEGVPEPVSAAPVVPQDPSAHGLGDGPLVVRLGQVGCSRQETVDRVTEREGGERDDPTCCGVETGEPVADRTVREPGAAAIGEAAADQLLDEVRDAIAAYGQRRHLVRRPVVGAEGACHGVHVLRLQPLEVHAQAVVDALQLAEQRPGRRVGGVVRAGRDHEKEPLVPHGP